MKDLTYEEFIQQKRIMAKTKGIEPKPINNKLFPFQKDIVNWALRKGKSAIFTDCGTGKTIMQLEWARQIHEYTNKPILILTPLAVAEQTKKEGNKFNIDVNIAHSQDEVVNGINITNYEKLHKFTANKFIGIVLDESSILKSFSGKIRTQIIEAFADTPFKLACTATPSPNDYMELGNHAEFLNVMTRSEMLATFFVHDGGNTSKWRLKGHAEDKFWEWVSSWAVVVRKPSDLGYEDGKFQLPPLNIIEHIVESPEDQEMIIPLVASTLNERRQARKDSIKNRVKKAAEIANATNEQFLVWCDFNEESKQLTEAINQAVEVKGSDNDEHKTSAMIGFANGKVRALVTKPSIAGWGMNWQNCNNMIFCGLSDSYEQFYQAIRRCWRFGQEKPVNVHVIISQKEIAVLDNIKRKEQDAERMSEKMFKYSKNIAQDTKPNERTFEYVSDIQTGTNWTMYLGDCVEEIKKIKDNSIHYSIFSPPFASLYTYSDSERDMGNSRDYEEFAEHFRYLVKELYRVVIPGRLISFHCMQLPLMKERDGIIGLRDFRGELIRLFQEEGWIYHSEVVIWKDPVVEMQRTKALGLLHKQIKKDSAMCRQGIPDYLVTMRKPGDNPEKISHTDKTFPVDLWQRYASPVWFDINQSNTLQKESAREEKDEKHICPLQLDVIERALMLWTNENDIVLSPFAGIGSEGYVALKMNRRFVGIELKESYYRQAVANLKNAENEKKQMNIFQIMGDEVVD